MAESLFELHAAVCKALAHSKRLEILAALQARELTAGDIVARVGTTKGNISQHLAVMRQAGILATRRVGANVYYRVTNSKIVEACSLMREVLFEALDARRAAVGRPTALGGGGAGSIRPRSATRSARRATRVRR